MAQKMSISLQFNAFFRREALDAFAGEKSFMCGKSVSNQRIEAWWGQLRRGCMDWWINYFKDLRDNGLYCDSDIFHTECLRFCFMPILKEELNKVAILWNLHRIRRSTNPESPPGRPDMLYFMPEINNTRDYKTALDMDDVDVVGETLGLQGNIWTVHLTLYLWPILLWERTVCWCLVTLMVLDLFISSY